MALNPTHLMHASTTHALAATASGAGVRWLVSVLRCLLLLLLVFDQVSSPFHAHLHEGAANMHQLAAAHVNAHAAEHHDAATDDSHSDDAHSASVQHSLASHPMLAIRAEAGRGLELSVAFDDSHMLVAPKAALDATSSPAEAISPQHRRNWATPDIPLHLSLPPASRAPPLLV